MKRPVSKGGVQGANALAVHEIVTLAAYLAGAERGRVDTEDIAVKANEIAPGRFTWRKYKDQIDLDLIYKHLWDLTKPKKGGYVTGSKNDGWLLTAAGTAFAEREVGKLEHLQAARATRPRNEEAWLKRERGRMLQEAAFAKVVAGRSAEISKVEAERFFHLDDYVVGQARMRKITHAENAFQDDPELGPAIKAIAPIARGAA